MRRRLCTDCGGPITHGSIKGRCRACWRNRGPETPEKPTIIATVCGHPTSRKGNRYCVACFNGKRSEIQKPHVAPSVLADAAGHEPKIIDALKTGAKTLEQLGAAVGATPGQALDALLALKAKGLNRPCRSSIPAYTSAFIECVRHGASAPCARR